MSAITNILVVCMGNICRSPTMEAVLKSKLAATELTTQVDSAGTIGYHQGNPPDPRSVAAGSARGYDFSGMAAQQVKPSDFEDYDLILCADESNYRDLVSICPSGLEHKVQLFLVYGEATESEVPDPYYGGEHGFEHVLDLIEAASETIINKIRLSTR
ncbi:low molecular weight protein-tyrosine-phosphatase [Pseudoalteromonas piscicida]|uniref:protein-tyrosine-phosphatase n=1 Tax=Pseudoalteromonas piscicida TaxID=43662 RepID=A0A2A5JPZ5_PSEO7|nr:low molecular weight protein-tyrosine-phosphatase [Pseudoalteromonas piscicida]PCK31341.1 protein-tyrosine-phosphatase [Pseudoalteromonas piscicida]